MEGGGGQGPAPSPARERRPVHAQPRRLCLAGVPATACFLPWDAPATPPDKVWLAEALRRLLRGTLSASAHPWPVASVGIASAWIGFQRRITRQIDALLAKADAVLAPGLVTEADLEGLPEPVGLATLVQGRRHPTAGDGAAQAGRPVPPGRGP